MQTVLYLVVMAALVAFAVTHRYALKQMEQIMAATLADLTAALDALRGHVAAKLQAKDGEIGTLTAENASLKQQLADAQTRPAAEDLQPAVDAVNAIDAAVQP